MWALQFIDTFKSESAARAAFKALQSQVSYLGGTVHSPSPSKPGWRVQVFFESTGQEQGLPDGVRRVLLTPAQLREYGITSWDTMGGKRRQAVPAHHCVMCGRPMDAATWKARPVCARCDQAGQARAAGGKRRKAKEKLSELDRPRIKFNWGYHDGAHEQQEGRPRELIEHGQQDLRHVSKDFDPNYYEGYRYGRAAARAGTYAGNSDPAWKDYIAENPAALRADRQHYHDCQVQDYGRVVTPYREGGGKRRQAGGSSSRTCPTCNGGGGCRWCAGQGCFQCGSTGICPDCGGKGTGSQAAGGKRRQPAARPPAGRLQSLVSDVNRLTR